MQRGGDKWKDPRYGPATYYVARLPIGHGSRRKSREGATGASAQIIWRVRQERLVACQASQANRPSLPQNATFAASVPRSSPIFAYFHRPRIFHSTLGSATTSNTLLVVVRLYRPLICSKGKGQSCFAPHYRPDEGFQISIPDCVFDVIHTDYIVVYGAFIFNCYCRQQNDRQACAHLSPQSCLFGWLPFESPPPRPPRFGLVRIPQYDYKCILNTINLSLHQSTLCSSDHFVAPSLPRAFPLRSSHNQRKAWTFPRPLKSTSPKFTRTTLVHSLSLSLGEPNVNWTSRSSSPTQNASLNVRTRHPYQKIEGSQESRICHEKTTQPDTPMNGLPRQIRDCRRCCREE